MRLTPDQRARELLKRERVDEMRARLAMKPWPWKPIERKRYVDAD